MSTDPTPDFDGCHRECRIKGKHSLVWGGCEQAVAPEPTVNMSVVFDDIDGHKSIGYDQYTVPQLARLIEGAVGDPLRAVAAARAIVHRNDPDAAPADPQTDRPRALHLLEAADFLRDAHFRDGLSVQEIGAALRLMADEADPMVGSLARDGVGLDEIVAMPVAPDQALRDRAAEAVDRVFETWRQGLGETRPQDAIVAAVLSVLPPGGRAVDRSLVIEALYEARRPGLGGMSEAEAVAHMADAVLRRLAAGERDEQQAQQGGRETRGPWTADGRLKPHAIPAATTPDQPSMTGGFDTSIEIPDVAAEVRQQPDPETRPARGDQFEQWLKAQRDAFGWRGANDRTLYNAVGSLLDTYRLHADTGTPLDQHACDGPHCDCPPTAAPVAGQPPADTGEEAQPRFVRVCIACPECDHTLDENGACANGCHDKGA